MASGSSIICGLCKTSPAVCCCACTTPLTPVCPACMPEHITSPLVHDVRSLPDPPRPTPLPEVFNEFCTVCKSAIPEAICCCEEDGVRICGRCIGNHNMKNLSKVHILLPIKARKYIKTPGYLERLRSRQISLESGMKEANANLQNLDKCMSELTTRIESALAAIQKYKQEQFAEIQRIKADLERTIAAARKEVEDHIYEDAYQPREAVAQAMWDFHPGTLVLFSYTPVDLYQVNIIWEGPKLHQKPHIPLAQLNSTTNATPSSTPKDQSPRSAASADVLSTSSLLRLTPSSLSYYNLTTRNFGRVIPLSPQIAISHMSSAALLPTGKIFVCGRDHPYSNLAFEIDPQTGISTALSPMHTPRFAHAVLPYKNCVYVLGGSGTTGFLKSCEKYISSNRQWTRISDMLNARDFFNPCQLRQFAFIFGGRNTANCEKYDIGNDLFVDLRVNLPVEGHAVAVMYENNSIVVLQSGIICTWTLGSTEVAVTRNKAVPGTVWGSMSPIRVGRDIYISQFYQSKVLKITI